MRPRNPLENFNNIIYLREVVFNSKLSLKKFGLRGLIETAEAHLVVSMTHGILYDTAEASVKTMIGSEFL
jgi:hypothetical protein